jgi:hypothetical protein
MARMQTGPSVPVPDPTVLTTQALQREIEAARERFDDKIVMVREVIEARLDGNDDAIALLRETVDKAPELLDHAIRQTRELIDERFRAIDTRFGERDIRNNAATSSNKEAITAALTAVREAGAKSETAFTKQIDQIMTLIGSTQKSIDDKVGDLKDRLTIIESRKVGEKEATTTQQQGSRDNTAFLALIISGAVAAVVITNFISAKMAG